MSVDYDQYLTRHFNHIAAPATVRRNALFAIEHHGRHFPADRQSAILEIGPGFGALLECMRLQCGYTNVRAVDISPEVVAACNQVAPGSTVQAEDTTLFLDERPAQFDLILMFHVLEHVPKDAVHPLLTAIRRALKDNGRLVVEVPNIAHPITGAYNRYHDFTHTVGFTDQSLAFVLRNAGFQQVTVYGCRTPRTNALRLVQRTAQDIVELLGALRLRLYLPKQAVTLATALGACANK